MEVNEIVHGFRLKKKEDVKEAAAVGYEFEHEKTGAQLFFLESDDDNKVFYIAFRTPPTDDTGVAHIVEHSVLCGSKKYPLKEPFVELVKGSLNTFLNAMTYPDKTVYPVASRNLQDFKNLTDVYLDAVFYPAMTKTPEIFWQEGWHYELENKNAPLSVSGVVYNEMKGALSSPDDLLESRITASLYPDTTYGFESGGDPDAIPSLTQEDFVAFHQKYYHPSNSRIYLYGDIDIEERLKYLDEEYLSHFEKISVPSEIGRQKFFAGDKIKTIDEKYPVGKDEDTAERTFLALNMIVGDALDHKTMLALEILDHALFKTEAAPIRRALMDAGIGKDIDSELQSEMLQPMFSIVAANAEADRAEKFCATALDSLKKIADEGIDRELLEASLNIFEFRLREADFGSLPKGLVYGLRALRSWLYGGDPAMYLRYEKALEEMRRDLASDYFESLVKKYFVANPHKTLITMSPDKKLAAEKENALAAKLAAVKEKMNDREIEKVIIAAKNLKLRQQEEDSPEALAKIPLLSLEDIKKEPEEFPLAEKEIAGAKILHSDVNTNGIIYLTLYFDAEKVPQDKLHQAYLLSDIIGAIDTKKRGYMELANKINLSTGGISADITAYTKKDEPDSFLPKFKIHAKALVTKLPELTEILREILSESVFADKKRLKELILEEQTSIEMSFQRAAHTIVASRIAANLSKSGRYADEGSLPFYGFIKRIAANFDAEFPKLRADLDELAKRIFNRNNLTIGVTVPEKDYAEFAKNLPQLTDGLCAERFADENYSWNLSRENDGLMNAGRVQYVGKGANYLKLGFPYTGAMQILETILRYNYFWTKIRVQGGAYGAFASFNRSGMMFFGSYRDPNLKETIGVFDGTADFLKNFSVTDREMDKFIIGTFALVDAPKTPKMKGAAAAELWLRSISYADRQKTRNEILSARQTEIKSLASVVETCMKENNLCVFGNEEKLRENAALFDRLVSVMD